MSRHVTVAPAPPAPDTGLEIRVLGPLEVRVDGVPLVVDTRKALAILALLAAERRPFAREELAAMLWPESDDASARGALRRTLSVLRSALGDRWLLVDRSTVTLDAAGTWIDLAIVEAADSDTSSAPLREASSVARGPFLSGFSLRDSPDFDDWRATRAVAAERTVARVLDRLASSAEGEGDLPAAVAAATRRLELDSLDEPAQRRLMLLLARSGDRAGAIRQYRACVAGLERELGVAPLAETTALYEAIRDERVPPSGRVAVPDELPPPGMAGLVPAPPTSGRLPLVGRAREMTVVLEAHGDAVPDGRVAYVTGEAGIGKSRLAEDLGAAVSAAGGAAIVGRSFASESGIAYGVIAELLRVGLNHPDALDRLRRLPSTTLNEIERLVPLPAELSVPRGEGNIRGVGEDGPAARARLLEAIAGALAALVAGPVPGLITIEDLQWADDASREALAWLARRLESRSLLLLLTWRPEDLDDLGSAFAATVDALPSAVSVPLRRLDGDDVERLVAAASTMGGPSMAADALLEESEGLPLFVVEALAAGTSTVEGPTRSVRALLRERLATVSETAGQVLSAAAVIGRSFDLPLVRGASGRSEDETVTALEELVRRGIVREAPATEVAFDFAHAKLRDAAYDATSLARRRLLHRRTAELLRAEGGGRDDPGRLVQIAIHERAAGREAEAADAFRQAGVQARSLFANREAAAHLETAIGLGHPEVAGIQLLLGEVRMALGDYAGAIAALEAAPQRRQTTSFRGSSSGSGGCTLAEAISRRRPATSTRRSRRSSLARRRPPPIFSRGRSSSGLSWPTVRASSTSPTSPRRARSASQKRSGTVRVPAPPTGFWGWLRGRPAIWTPRGRPWGRVSPWRTPIRMQGRRSRPAMPWPWSRQPPAIGLPRSRCSRPPSTSAAERASATSRRPSRTASRTSFTPWVGPTKRWRTSSRRWRSSPRSVGTPASWSRRSGSSSPGRALPRQCVRARHGNERMDAPESGAWIATLRPADPAAAGRDPEGTIHDPR